MDDKIEYIAGLVEQGKPLDEAYLHAQRRYGLTQRQLSTLVQDELTRVADAYYRVQAIVLPDGDE